MNFDDFSQAVQNAKEDVRRGDEAVQQLCKLAAGRLRSAGVSGYVLAELKRELRDFNMVTKDWNPRDAK
jgi:hypothetical protein